MRRLLTLGQPSRKTTLQAYLHSRKPLALVGALVLCLFACILSTNEAWAKEQASKDQSTGESTLIVNGKQVAEPALTPVSPPVGTTPPLETPSNETLPPPPSNSVTVNSVPPKADPEPPSKAKPEPAWQLTSVERTVLITTTGGETVGPSTAEPASAPQKSEPAPTTESTPTTDTTPSKPASVAASAAPRPDLGSPETEIPAAKEELPAALPANLSRAPSEASEPVITAPALQQQVAQGVASLQRVASQEQSRPSYYSASEITPASVAVQPLTWSLNNVIGPSASATASAENSSASHGTWPAPSAPVSPDEPLGSSYVGLSYGMGQASAGGLGTTLLLGVLFVTSIMLLRRDFRTYLVSIELPKPSSALPSPLERPG